MTTVLVHSTRWGRRMEALEARFPDVGFVRVDPDEPVPAEVAGEVLFAQTFRPSNVEAVLGRGVQWVHSAGHGVDHLPLELMEGMVVTCSRGLSATPMAEWVVAMLLTAVKDLPASWVEEPPDRWNWTDLENLEGQTVALLGFGSVNRAVAERLRPFGCRLVAVRHSGDDPEVDGVVSAATPGEAVFGADHVVVGMPGTDETRGLVDQDLMAAMKPGAHLVNVARGSIVDQEALREALESGQVGLASLDVVEPEPLPEGHWLYGHPQVRLSPHVSWACPDALDQVYGTFAANLGRWLDGEPLEGVVDRTAGY